MLLSDIYHHEQNHRVNFCVFYISFESNVDSFVNLFLSEVFPLCLYRGLFRYIRINEEVFLLGFFLQQFMFVGSRVFSRKLHSGSAHLYSHNKTVFRKLFLYSLHSMIVKTRQLEM